jgi:hypothetical protein
VATAKLNVTVSPSWRLETLATATNLDSPRLGEPDLSNHERYVREGLRYLGVANLSAGVEVAYLKGSFLGAAAGLGAPYSQTTAQLAANYQVSGVTSLNAAVGDSRRTQQGNDLSAVTGKLAYVRQLTGKTSVNLQLTRAVNSYLNNAGSEVDTTASIGAVWQATWRIAVNPSYTWELSKFPGFPDTEGVTYLTTPGTGQPITSGADRVDHLQSANLSVSYQALQWLSIQLYGRYQTRTSNDPAFPFKVNVVGIDVKARLP